MWSPHGLGMGGMNQLMVQVDGRSSRLCGVEGESWVKYGEVERCWWLVERAPLLEGRALMGEGAPFLFI